MGATGGIPATGGRCETDWRTAAHPAPGLGVDESLIDLGQDWLTARLSGVDLTS